MAGSMTEDNYIGEHEIIRQGSEVERIIFVKSGFCKVVRELHPKPLGEAWRSRWGRAGVDENGDVIGP